MRRSVSAAGVALAVLLGSPFRARWAWRRTRSRRQARRPEEARRPQETGPEARRQEGREEGRDAHLAAPAKKAAPKQTRRSSLTTRSSPTDVQERGSRPVPGPPDRRQGLLRDPDRRPGQGHALGHADREDPARQRLRRQPGRRPGGALGAAGRRRPAARRQVSTSGPTSRTRSRTPSRRTRSTPIIERLPGAGLRQGQGAGHRGDRAVHGRPARVQRQRRLDGRGADPRRDVHRVASSRSPSNIETKVLVTYRPRAAGPSGGPRPGIPSRRRASQGGRAPSCSTTAWSSCPRSR